MKLEKAIEIVETCHGHGGIAHNKDYINAQKLLIEAGKRIKERRYLNTGSWLPLLPGETKE